MQMLRNFTLAMEEKYPRDKACKKARAMLSFLGVSEEKLEEFDALCQDFDLTIEDVTDWEDLNDGFFNPQTVDM